MAATRPEILAEIWQPSRMAKAPQRKIALVLGSGAARGWSHIGVIRALEEAGIYPTLVCGTSVGAVVGAALAAGRLNQLESWISGLNQMDILSLLDRGLGNGGLVNGGKLMDAFANQVGDGRIEDMELEFAAVATDIENGREVWLKTGSAIDAVRASIAIPGIFSPVCIDDRWLVDGGLVNPVPVSTARALGADFVIAVNLNGDLVGTPGARRRYARPDSAKDDSRSLLAKARNWLAIRRRWAMVGKALLSGSRADERETPGILSVIADSIDIMQDRITRARLAGEPPDVLISPRLGHVGILEFDRAEEVIRIGRECTENQLDEIKRLLDG